MPTNPQTGLMAAAPVKWLLDNEPDVCREVMKFIRGKRNTDYIDVALPPSWLAMLRLRVDRHAHMEFPLIRLSMKMVDDHISGIPHVLVTCADDDLEAICGMHATVMQKRQEIALTAELKATGA